MIGSPHREEIARANAARARFDAKFALEPGSGTAGPAAAHSIPAAWIDQRDIDRAAACQKAWDTAPRAARDAARRRLDAIMRSEDIAARGCPYAEADAAAAHETGLSPGTVGKWRRSYHGRAPIARLARLLDDRFQRGVGLWL